MIQKRFREFKNAYKCLKKKYLYSKDCVNFSWIENFYS